MSESADKLRNIALVAHGGAGKTSLAEVMLNKAGITTRIGRVEDGNTVMDFEPEEIKRQSSISTGLHQFPWEKHALTLLDTPGDQNFFSDTRLCMQAADSVVLVIDAVDGVKFQTEQAWDFATEFGHPGVIFINKLDRERADFKRTLDDAVASFNPKPITVQLPIGKEADFNGIVDLLEKKAYLYDDSGAATAMDIPADMQGDVETAYEALVEDIAEADDALLERYLEGETLSGEELGQALRKGVLGRRFIPVLCGSATHNIGADKLMDFIVTALPSPTDRGSWQGLDPVTGDTIERQPDPEAPFSAFVFKTIADPYAGRLTLFRVVSGSLGGDGGFYNVTKETKERYNQILTVMGKEQKPAPGAGPGAIAAFAKLKETVTGDTICDEGDKIAYECAEPLRSLIAYAISPKSKGDEDKIYGALTKILEEDPALSLERNAETRQTLLKGRGQVHIESAVEKLKRKYSVGVVLNLPKVPYRETIKRKIRVQGKHKKQTGGHGQFGDCWVQFEPLPNGSGFEFVDAIVGGAIPKTYIPAVEKGIGEAAGKGAVAGYPTVDFKATLDDGSFHAVDSSEMAFKIAGSLAFRKAIADAAPVLLEPVMTVQVKTPDDFMGDIMGDLNSRRGRVLGMDSEGKYQVINAQVPMAEILTYAPDLRSITGGRGTFSMEFDHYEEVPAQLAEKLIEKLKAEREDSANA